MLTLNRVILPKMIWTDSHGRVPRGINLSDINVLDRGTNCTQLNVILPGSTDRSYLEILLTVSDKLFALLDMLLEIDQRHGGPPPWLWTFTPCG